MGPDKHRYRSFHHEYMKNMLMSPFTKISLGIAFHHYNWLTNEIEIPKKFGIFVRFTNKKYPKYKF